MKTARHRFVENEVVEFKLLDSFQGEPTYLVVYSNGLRITMRPGRFHELFKEENAA